jgi:lysophospholipase L1-like esterase
MSSKKQIILIGDSLTDWSFGENGWGKKMQDWYGEKVSIINEGYAGYTSKMIKEIINNIVPKNDNEILLCSILLGTNDCFNREIHVSFQDYKINMLYIIDYIHSIHPKTEILLITPPLSGFQIKITDYVDALYQIKTERDFINIVDVINPNPSHSCPINIVLSDLSDGLHLNDSGNDKLFKNVQNAIFYHYNHYIPSKLM